MQPSPALFLHPHPVNPPPRSLEFSLPVPQPRELSPNQTSCLPVHGLPLTLHSQRKPRVHLRAPWLRNLHDPILLERIAQRWPLALLQLPAHCERLQGLSSRVVLLADCRSALGLCGTINLLSHGRGSSVMWSETSQGLRRLSEGFEVIEND